MVLELESLSIVIAAIMLIYTSYLDLKKREVEDKVWIAFGVLASAIQGYEVLTGQTSLTYLVISLVLATVIGMGLFFFGFYGGADGKALIVVAIFVPYFEPAVGLHWIAPLIVLTNGVLLSMLLPMIIASLNFYRILRAENIFDGFVEPFHRRILASLLGYKQMGKPRAFQFPMEKKETIVTLEGERKEIKKFDFSMMRDDFERRSGTWVTPGIPLLVFFTLGFFALLIYGDLIIGIIQFFFRLAA